MFGMSVCDGFLQLEQENLDMPNMQSDPQCIEL